MNRSVVLMVVLGAILVGAVVLERTLVASAEQSVVAPKPVPAPAPVAARPTPAPEPGSLIPPPPMPVAGLPAAPSPAAATVGQPPPTEVDAAPEPLNPFTADDSREVEYAFQLVVGPNSTVDTAKNAAEVFERCLKQFPKNARCYQGLVAAQQRQQMPNWRPPGAPAPLAEGQAPPPPVTRPFPRPTFGARRVITPPPASAAPTE